MWLIRWLSDATSRLNRRRVLWIWAILQTLLALGFDRLADATPPASVAHTVAHFVSIFVIVVALDGWRMVFFPRSRRNGTR